MYKDLRFFGHYIHDVAGYERGQAMVREEMKARLPDEQHPGGYSPDETFKREASRFSEAYREMRDEMMARARARGKVTYEEYVTLVRGERLNVEANSQSGLAGHRLSLLEAGKNPFGFGGMSDSRMIEKLTGLGGNDGPRDRFTINIDHGLRR